mgnify:CR=1 FL=1
MFEIGDKVRIVLLELDAFITAICFRSHNNVTFEISYFSNGEYNQKWVEYFEIEKRPGNA